MNPQAHARPLPWALIGVLLLAAPGLCLAGGLTFITHGLNGNTDGWVTGMADQISKYPGFPGANATLYKAYFYSKIVLPG